MNTGGQLYRLQQVELEIRGKRQVLGEVESSLQDDSALVEARDRLAAGEQSLAVTMKKQQNAEWEVGDLQDKKKKVNYKLYSGAVKNPKELSSLESELASLKSRTKEWEDDLLELMTMVEDLEAEVSANNEGLKDLQREWQERQVALGHRKGEIEAELVELEEARRGEVESIDSEALEFYDLLKSTCGWAVARVEGGKCQGCHIALPTGQWQKARSGEMVQCSNCGRILYLE